MRDEYLILATCFLVLWLVSGQRKVVVMERGESLREVRREEAA